MRIAPSMSNAMASPARRVSSPSTSNAPASGSTIATSGPVRLAAGAPICANMSPVPAIPMTNSFCPPCTRNTRPRARRRMSNPTPNCRCDGVVANTFMRVSRRRAKERRRTDVRRARVGHRRVWATRCARYVAPELLAKTNHLREAISMTTAPSTRSATATNSTPLTNRPEWRALESHAAAMQSVHLRSLFASDPSRGTRLTAEAAGLYVDYSKHRITNETLDHLVALAEASGLRDRIEAMMRGDRINVTENRQVLHVALRAPRT